MKRERCNHLFSFFTYHFSCGARCIRVASYMNKIKFKVRDIKEKEMSFENFKNYFDKRGIKTSSYKGYSLLSNSIYQVKYKGNFHFVYLLDKGYRKSLLYDPAKILPFFFISNQKLERKLTGYIFNIESEINPKRAFWYIISRIIDLINFILFIFVIKIIVSVI